MMLKRMLIGGAALALAATISGVVALRRVPADPALWSTDVTEFPLALFADARTRRAFLVTTPLVTTPLGASGTHVTVIDLDTGRALRTVTAGWGVSSDAPAALDRRTARLVVATTTSARAASGGAAPTFAGRVTVLDTRSGAVVRAWALGVAPQDIVVDEAIGHAFVVSAGLDGTGMGLVGMLDTHSGRLLRTSVVDIPAWNETTVDVTARRVYVPVYVPAFARASSARVSILDARSGAVERSVALGAAAPVSVAATGLGSILVSSYGGVRLIDPRPGRPVPPIPIQAPAGDARIGVDTPLHRAVIVTVARATLLDLDRGAAIGSVRDAQPASTPAFDDHSGHLFVLVQPMTAAYVPIGRGSVTMLDTRHGTVLGTAAVGVDPVAVTVDAARGRVLVLNHGTTRRGSPALTDGSVSVLDARTGTLRATIPVGADPVALAVDDRTGRVIVVTGPTTVLTPDPWGWLPPWIRQHLPFVPGAATLLRPVPTTVRALDPTRQ